MLTLSYITKKNLAIAKTTVLGYNVATSLGFQISFECLQLLIELNTGATAKKYALQYLHLNDSITKVRQRAKISMLKLDTIRKGRRKTYNLKYKNRARSYTKEKYLLPHRGNHHGGIV
jgi:hypothetical protein